MKAVDFIRKFGWEEARDFYYWASKNKINFAPDDFKLTVLGGYIYYLDLKTYVDAWELVQKMGGTIDEIKEHVRVTERNLKRGVYFECTIERNINRINRIKKAIALVDEVCGG